MKFLYFANLMDLQIHLVGSCSTPAMLHQQP